MDKRIRDSLPPQFWLLRILAVNLASFPLTIGAWNLIPEEAIRILSRMGFNNFILIYFVYFSWTFLILIAWRLHESHFLSGDLSKTVILTAVFGLFVTPILYLILYFEEVFRSI